VTVNVVVVIVVAVAVVVVVVVTFKHTLHLGLKTCGCFPTIKLWSSFSATPAHLGLASHMVSNSNGSASLQFGSSITSVQSPVNKPIAKV
jgi:hypothetical protein